VVEHLAFNQRVDGSIPSRPTNKYADFSPISFAPSAAGTYNVINTISVSGSAFADRPER
jgi:hypothetical protein